MATSRNSISLDELDSIMNLQRQEAFDEELPRSRPSSSSNLKPPTSSGSNKNINKNGNGNGNSKSNGKLDSSMLADIESSGNQQRLAKIINEPTPPPKNKPKFRSKSNGSITGLPRNQPSGSSTSTRRVSAASCSTSVTSGCSEASDSKKELRKGKQQEQYGEGEGEGGTRPSSRRIVNRERKPSSNSVKSLETVLSTDEGGTKGSAAAAANESRREPIKRERRDSSNRKIPETVGKRRESSTSSRRLSASKEVASTSDESEKEKKRVAMSEQRKPPSRREVVVADTVTVKPQSTKALGVKTSKKFERLWGADADADEGESNDDFDEQKPMKKPLTTFLTRQHSDPRMNGKGKNAKGSTSTQSVGGAMSRSNSEDSGKKPKSTPALLDGIKKKSKLDKINELQAKYEKYKNEWVQVTKEKNKTKKELNQKKVEVVSLTKEVDTHMAETGILRKGLSEALQKADKLSEEQRLEREGYASTAKELAQARIDYTKSLNEARELRADLDGADAALEEKDRKISSLTQAVESQIGKIDDLEFKLDRAEDDIKNIEDEMNAMEDELLLYRSAAAKGDDDDDPSKNHLKNVRDDMERNLKEEREQRLEEKQKKLDEKLREFEEERERHLEKENQRVFQEAEGQLKDTIKHKERDEERQKMDDQINQRLKELEDDNSALQARLKSEQLDSSVKLKKKEETVVSLQMDMAKVKKDLADRDSDPESVNTLKEEVANLKEDAESTAMDLEDAQKHNGMLQEEIEDLQSVQTVLRTEMKNLQTEAVDSKRQVAEWKRKSDEWKTKVGEWTEKAFQWKEKAELWENRVKELNPDGAESEGESKKNPAKEITPQELFLQAAMEKKKASSTAPGGWGRIGGLFSKGSEGGMEDDEAQTRIKELEEANAAQHETIKLLRSELVKVQASFKEEAYNATKKLQQLHAENQAVELKNTNLQKELELARKLQGLASQYDT